MAGLSRGIRPPAFHPIWWHSYAKAMEPGADFFQHGVRNAAIQCMNRLGERVKKGETWQQAVESRKAEVEAARGT